MSASMSVQVQDIIKELADELRPAVAELEAAPAATKDHYGAYMGIISKFAGKQKGYGNIAVLALLAAGANREGVAAAYRICFG